MTRGGKRTRGHRIAAHRPANLGLRRPPSRRRWRGRRATLKLDWNRGKVASAVTTLTAVAAPLFTAVSQVSERFIV